MKLPTRRCSAAARHAEEDAALATASAACRSSAARCTARSRRSARDWGGAAGRVRADAGRSALGRAVRHGAPLARPRVARATVSAGPCFGGEGGVRAASPRLWRGQGRGVRRRRLCDRHRDRRDRDEPRARRARGGDAANAAVRPGRPAGAGGRVSSADERDRHRGVSHHTRAVLSLCRDGVTVAWPPGSRRPAGSSRGSRSTPRAGVRRAPGCRSRTWAAARTRSRGSSRPPSPPGGLRATRELMEERRLGPVVGLGTWNTFGGDGGLPRDVVGTAFGAGAASSTRRRCTAAPSARSATRWPSRRREAVVATKIWSRAVEEGREHFERQLGGSAASRSSRCTTSSPGAEQLAVARGGARRRADRPARRHALLRGRIRRARGGAADRPFDAAGSAQPARARVRGAVAAARGRARDRGAS